MNSYHIHIEGQVQGVGFRPFVWRVANHYNLTGWVSNGVNGVHIDVHGDQEVCRTFFEQIIREAPQHARITRYSIRRSDTTRPDDFTIRESLEGGVPDLLITPDLATCERCREEIYHQSDRRFQYAFTTCTHCGPRYSIMQKLPYDRPHTTMQAFDMCVACEQEYNSRTDRRYYSQTNSCPVCAVTMTLTDATGQVITADQDRVLPAVAEHLRAGKIVAIKGIGGYLILCDAARVSTIRLLRERKHRPSKPFAVMYPSLEALQHDAYLTTDEAEALTSPEAPVVLVRPQAFIPVALDSIAPGLDTLGVMLPYTPMMHLLLREFGKPVVATSGNESGSPIFYRDEDARTQLADIVDYFVLHNRDIVVPQDDSVVRYTKSRQRIVLRRSRGLAPTFLPNPLTEESRTWLAMGSDMKSAFALLHHHQVHVSQYLGDLSVYPTQQSYKHVLQHLMGLMDATPVRILVDKHPMYYSSTFGATLAGPKATITPVQHHKAHLCAVLAENDLLDTEDPVLGVIWDGTGWGDDGQVWGGEFFRFQSGMMARVEHLQYFTHMLGDKLSREPRLAAFALAGDMPDARDLLESKFTPVEWSVFARVRDHFAALQSSSVGRLFDAVASLLGLGDAVSFEGEAAMKLEALANRVHMYAGQYDDWDFPEKFTREALMQHIVNAIHAGVPREVIAYQFHVSLVQWVDEVASRQSVSKLAFSGGVFQNALLIDLLYERLGSQYELYFHKQLAPNDECIGFGQLAYCYGQRFAQQRLASKIPGEIELVTIP